MKWRLKCLLYWILSVMPFGHKAYLLIQQFVTRSIPRTYAPTTRSAHEILWHLRNLQRYGDDISNIRYFEFGAGWDLYDNLVLYCMGVEHQIVTDVYAHATLQAVNRSILHLRKEPPPDSRRIPQTTKLANLSESLRETFGIDYRAPVDATQTGIETGTIDAIVTTHTL